MSFDNEAIFTKENLDGYLKELAKAFRKRNGTSMPAEIILVGGAAILVNYGFRAMTTDIDAIIHAASSMKDAINEVGNRHDLPAGWLNTEFTQTGSFSPKLVEHSVYYRTFSNVLQIRTVSAEYLIAIKLRSGRQYKNDLSDVLGILAEHEKRGEPILFERIKIAVDHLYGHWESLPTESRVFIENAFSRGNFQKAYASIRQAEQDAKTMLLDFEQQYPGTIKEENVNEILNHLKPNKDTILQALKKKDRNATR